MDDPAKRGFSSDFRRFFTRGLVILLPTVLTIVLLVKGYQFVQENISVHVTNGILYTVVYFFEDYPEITEEDINAYMNEYPTVRKNDIEKPNVQRDIRWYVLSQRWNSGAYSLVGFLLAIVLVYIVGRLFASLLGKRLWRFLEGTIHRVPLFNKVYPYIKQITDYLFGDERVQFSRVVAVPYPRDGIYSIGLVTGAGFKHVHEATKNEFLTVFIPSSPTPVTGYVIYVKKEEVIDLPITIEEALRFAVSGGVIVPNHQMLPGQLNEMAPTHTGDKKNNKTRPTPVSDQ
ncbi:MAG: DUF502 domain-containing protein [Sedimentisphaerales bacterium]|nr:DUF502 domain-containing protein [Sedimentisphaerales bacterium]